MKSLVLIKQHPSIQFAHLYEHIFCMQVQRLFSANGLYKYVDYSVMGTTFHEGGIVEVDVRAYNSPATALLPAIKNLPIDFSENIIVTAFTQLLAEEEQPLSSTGFPSTQKALIELHSQPWTDLDDYYITDTKNIRHKSAPVFVSKGNPLPARNLMVVITLDKEFSKAHPKLLPLFYQIAKVYALTGRDHLAAINRYYSDDIAFKNSLAEISLRTILKVANANDVFVNIEQDIKIYQKVFKEMQTNGAFMRLLKQLQEVSYHHAVHSAPNEEEILQGTSILIGSKGWREIATPENIELLLKHMSIEVKFGRKKVSAPLIKD